jgi:hypothetical protein
MKHAHGGMAVGLIERRQADPLRLFLVQVEVDGWLLAAGAADGSMIAV